MSQHEAKRYLEQVVLDDTFRTTVETDLESSFKGFDLSDQEKLAIAHRGPDIAALIAQIALMSDHDRGSPAGVGGMAPHRASQPRGVTLADPDSAGSDYSSGPPATDVNIRPIAVVPVTSNFSPPPTVRPSPPTPTVRPSPSPTVNPSPSPTTRSSAAGQRKTAGIEISARPIESSAYALQLPFAPGAVVIFPTVPQRASDEAEFIANGGLDASQSSTELARRTAIAAIQRVVESVRSTGGNERLEHLLTLTSLLEQV